MASFFQKTDQRGRTTIAIVEKFVDTMEMIKSSKPDDHNEYDFRQTFAPKFTSPAADTEIKIGKNIGNISISLVDMADLFETDDADDGNETTVDFASNENEEHLKRQQAVDNFMTIFEHPSNQAGI